MFGCFVSFFPFIYVTCDDIIPFCGKFAQVHLVHFTEPLLSSIEVNLNVGKILWIYCFFFYQYEKVILFLIQECLAEVNII